VAAGVPMLAMPLAFEQPGIGARIAHHGIGLTLPPRRRDVASIRAALVRLLSDRAFRDNLSRPRAELRAAGGVRRGADLIEKMIRGRAAGDAA